jgi:hypothetical protein
MNGHKVAVSLTILRERRLHLIFWWFTFQAIIIRKLEDRIYPSYPSNKVIKQVNQDGTGVSTHINTFFTENGQKVVALSCHLIPKSAL